MDSKRQKLEERLEKGERRHEEERFNKVNEAPVEAEEMEGPVQLWAGAGEGAGRGWEVHTRPGTSGIFLAMMGDSQPQETIKLEELQKRRKKRGIYRKPKKPDYFERLPLVCSCRTMCCCHRTCCCPTSCTCVCNFSSHCEKQARLVTRGVGSRLMLAMGWQVDQGLGREGQGRVEPTVPAWVYPQGKSIDWCMEAREEERRRRRRVEEEVVAYPSGKRVNIAWVREDGPCGRLGRLRRVPL